MVDEFTVGFRNTERELDFTVALSMSAEGAGAALFLIASLLGVSSVAAVGLALVCVGIGCLFAHLGHPLRFWRVVSKASGAWISRGALVTAGLVATGAAALALPEATAIGVAARVASMLCALLVMLYAGLLYASMPAVPFWNNALLPLLFLFHSLASGAGLALGLLPVAGRNLLGEPRALATVIALMLFCLALTVIYSRPPSPGEAVRESVRMLTQGKLRPWFAGGSLLIGLALPALLVALAAAVSAQVGALSGALSGAMLMAVVLFRLGGDVSFRYAVLRAGVYEPVL